jgi:hypothetical protein
LAGLLADADDGAITRARRRLGAEPLLALAITPRLLSCCGTRYPKRRLGANPRVIKRKMSNFGVKRAAHRCWPQPDQPTRRSSSCRPPGPLGPADDHRRPPTQ